MYKSAYRPDNVALLKLEGYIGEVERRAKTSTTCRAPTQMGGGAVGFDEVGVPGEIALDAAFEVGGEGLVWIRRVRSDSPDVLPSR